MTDHCRASVQEAHVCKDNMGSDHWPVVCEIQKSVQKQNISQCVWGFKQARWK